MKKYYDTFVDGSKGGGIIDKSKNSINALFPYRVNENLWVYDDVELGVYNEAFVLGSSELINELVGMDCDKFTMFISSSLIPGYTVKLEKIKDREDGWYKAMELDMEHWLCGQVLSYFPGFPDEIYVLIQK